jgi:hypothetical protein
MRPVHGILAGLLALAALAPCSAAPAHTPQERAYCTMMGEAVETLAIVRDTHRDLATGMYIAAYVYQLVPGSDDYVKLEAMGELVYRMPHTRSQELRRLVRSHCLRGK